MATDEIRSGMGNIGFWGSTPAYDLVDLAKRSSTSNSVEKTNLNILTLGQADCRHVLKTLAQHMEIVNNDNEVHLYIVESHPIIYARELLFLHLALLPTDQLGLHEKTTEFMEIFGNMAIRPQTRKTLKTSCETLIKLVTDDNFREQVLPNVHLEEMKHKERDVIAEILKFWVESNMKSEDIQNFWDIRVRQCLSTRYDSRMSVFDWDYQMKMTDKNGDTKIISLTEYQQWRKLGNAFSQSENDYNQPNVTFVPGKEYMYNGDILIGPFIPFGIKTEDDSFYEMANREYVKKSQDLTFHNLENIFKATSSFKSQKLHVHFLPLDTNQSLWRKSKYLQKFDRILVSNFIGHQVTPELIKLLKSDGVVLVEKSRYIWYFRDENDKAYVKKVTELGKAAGLECISQETGDNILKDDFWVFRMKIETIEKQVSQLQI